MIKTMSPTRKEYEQNYRFLRLSSGMPEQWRRLRYLKDTQDCAILSYDYHDSEFSGWINRQRFHQFEQRQQAIGLGRYWIPF